MNVLKIKFGSLLESGKELLFPSVCLYCRRYLQSDALPLLCSYCKEKLPLLVRPYCTCCGYPFSTGKDHLCGNCLTSSFAFDMARSAFKYKEVIPSLIQAFKYSGQMSGLSSMGILAQNSLGYLDYSTPDLIVPVPLHRKRLQERGFNQALLLARICFPKWQQCIFVDVLIRNRFTAAQSNLSGLERRRNLKGAFSVRSGTVTGKNVLLVDDVFTTGTTVNECSKQLYLAGASRVEIFTFARVV